MPLPNPFGEGDPLMEVSADVSDILFNKLLYLKKLIEDTAASEETKSLLRVSLSEVHIKILFTGVID